MLNGKAAACCMAPRGLTPALKTYRRSMMTGNNTEKPKYTQCRKPKCEAADAVEARDPGVPYESRWAPYVRIHGPGQGQFPKGSIRPRGYVGS